MSATSVASMRRVERHMGTAVSLQAHDAPEDAADRFFDEIQDLEAKLSIGELTKIAGPVVVAEQGHAADLIGQQPTYRIDACLAQAVHAAELLLDGDFFLRRVVPVGVRDLREQAGDRGHDSPCRVVGVREVLLDDFREAVARLGRPFFRLVFATKDHRGLNIPAALDTQGH